VTPTPAVLGNVQQPPAPAVLGNTLVRAPVHSGLPFTGADVAELAGLGVVLVGAGVGIRRLGRRRAPTD
jgi:hypothetical protein